MNVELLQTKLNLPPIRASGQRVARPRLQRQLNDGLHGRLTLISAPAGFGKTTLLGEWIHQNDLPLRPAVAWVSLDRQDNDPVRFWSYVLAALEAVRPGLGGQSRAVLQSTPGPAPVSAASRPGISPSRPPADQRQSRWLELALIGLINQIAAIPPSATVVPPLVLVLDDYHAIEARPIHETLAFLVEHLPPPADEGGASQGMHLVVASRTDPPLPLARLRARGQLAELRAEDLRFTLDEAAALFNQVMGLSLSNQDVAALEARTEGWAAGLQLAALALGGSRAYDQVELPAAGQPGRVASEFIQAFAGSHRYVLDYLVDEVLSQQPPQIQSFLLETSILDRLGGSLCEAVTGQDDCHSILEQLDTRNLFVVPLDEQRLWYRYHHLFAGFLQTRLGQVSPDRIPTLHRRAAEWHRRHGLLHQAIDHTLAAGDADQAADLIEPIARQVLMRSEIGTFLGWLEQLPHELIVSRPQLGVCYAWALVANGQIDRVEQCLEKAAAADREGTLTGEIEAVRATLAVFAGQYEHIAARAHKALAHLSEEDIFLRGMIAMDLAIPYMLDGAVGPAIQAFGEAARLSQQAGNVLVAVISLCQMAELLIVQGQLRQAAETYRRALKLATGQDGRALPLTGMVYAGLGEVLRQWNDLAGAEAYLTQGIDLISRWTSVETGTFDVYILLARLRQAQGDPQGALQVIRRSEQLAEKLEAMILDDVVVAICKARLWILQGNLSAASQWAAQTGLLTAPYDLTLRYEGQPVALPYHLYEYAALTVTRIMIARDELDQADKLLTRLLERAEQMERTGSVIEILALRALVYQAGRQFDQALAVLTSSLQLAEPEGYVRLFVDEGEAMERLLQGAANRGIAPRYIAKLLGAFAAAPIAKTDQRTALAVGQLVEPLGEREEQVLQLIAAGLSNRQIADRLIIAPSTVKWHINNLYSKLGVGSRTQAVARGRELGLL